MSLLLLFPSTTGGGGGTITVYASPILLIKKGTLAIHIGAAGNDYLEL